MKKHIVLVLTVVAFLFSMLCFWYSDALINRYFVFGLIPFGVALLMLIGSVVASVVFAIRNKNRANAYVPLLISMVTVVLIVVFPVRATRVNVEMALFEQGRLEVVQMVREGELAVDHLGNAKLPKGYGHLSSDGEIFVYQNNGEQVVSFWVFRGMLSGSVELMYSSGDEALIYANESGHQITHVEKLKDHWFLVETEY